MTIAGTVRKYNKKACMKIENGWVVYKTLEVDTNNILVTLNVQSFTEVMDWIDANC